MTVSTGRVGFLTGAKYRPISLLTVISLRTAGRLAALTVLALVLLAPAARASSASHAPGELVVRYRAGTTRARARPTIRARGGRPLRGHGRATSSQRVAHRPARRALADAAASCEADQPRRATRCRTTSPRDRLPARTTPAAGTGRWTGVQWNFLDPFGISARGAWDNAIAAGAPGGQGVVVAVLDTGVAYRTRRDRRYRRRPTSTASASCGATTSSAATPCRTTATATARSSPGTIAQATNNGIGVTGVAYQLRIMPVRVLDFEGKGDVATIASGIRFAARRGADIINMSFEFDIGLTASQIPDVISAIRYAHRKGVGAGRGRRQRRGHARRLSGAAPATCIAVGATTEHGCLAEYSNTGSGPRPGRARAEARMPSVDGDPNCQSVRERGPRHLPVHVHRHRARSASACPPATRAPRWRCRTCRARSRCCSAPGCSAPDPRRRRSTQRLETTARDLGTARLRLALRLGAAGRDRGHAAQRPRPVRRL